MTSLRSLPEQRALARRDRGAMLRRMSPPDLDDVARRAQCVLGLLVRAQIEEQLAAAPDSAKQWTRPLERLETWLVNERLDPQLTEEETALMRAKWGEWAPADVSAAVWRIEGLAVLLWACSRLPALPPLYEAAPADEVFAAIPFLRTTGDVLAGARLIPSDEVDRLRRAAGVFRWRAKTELLHRGGVRPSTGEPFEAMIRRATENAAKAGFVTLLDGDFDLGGRRYSALDDGELHTVASVALERGRAAEWLCGRARWDSPAEL